MLAYHRHIQVGPTGAADLLRQPVAQPARGVRAAEHLVEQLLPLGTRDAAVLEVGARVLAAVVEEALVVVLRLEREDLALNESVEVGQEPDQVVGQSKIHKSS